MGTIVDIKYDPITGQPIYRARANHAEKGSEWHKQLETNGSTCYFMDADPVDGVVGKTEMYDKDAGEWVEQPTGGGGGGGGGEIDELVDTTNVALSFSPVTAADVYTKYKYIYAEIQMHFTDAAEKHLYTTTIPVATIRTGISYMPCRENNNAGKDCAGRIMFNADGSISAMKIAIGGYEGCERLRIFGIN